MSIINDDFTEAERRVIQAAIQFHCHCDDTEREDEFHQAVSELIELRFQSVVGKRKGQA